MKDFETKPWRLLYRGTRGSFRDAHFHLKCDQRSHTVTIILTTAGYIFGGFTPIAWDSSNTWKADNTGKSFLFSLKNPRNTAPKIFPLSNASQVIYCILHMVQDLELVMTSVLRTVAIRTHTVTQTLEVPTRTIQELPVTRFSLASITSRWRRLKFSQPVPKLTSPYFQFPHVLSWLMTISFRSCAWDLIFHVWTDSKQTVHHVHSYQFRSIWGEKPTV
jgi:hypothetical protein